MSAKNVTPEDFDWGLYEDGYTGANLKANKKIKSGDKRIVVYSHEKYADDAYNPYLDATHDACPKDEIVGTIMPIVDVRVAATGNHLLVDTSGHATMRIDMNKERDLAKAYGYKSTSDFIDAINDPERKEKFLAEKPVIKVVSKERCSMWDGHLALLEEEFKQQIKNPTKGYVAKLLSCNNGGYMCNVAGIDGFIPGGQAAPGIITDFQALVGKEIPVKVINYVHRYGFIFSYKAFLHSIMPILVDRELAVNQKHVCTITGIRPNGIFVSFCDRHNEPVFEGFIHRTEMSLDFERDFDDNLYRDGDIILAYIHSILTEGSDIRIILGDCDMNSREYAVRVWANEEQAKFNAAQTPFSKVSNVATPKKGGFQKKSK